MAKKRNIIGEKFGKLTVIKEDLDKLTKLDSGGYNHYYICECECGNIITTSKRSLLNGHTKSCGCAKVGSQRENLTGKKFNRLLVIKLDEERTKKSLEDFRSGLTNCTRTYWICKCDCGKIKTITSYQLKSGETKSCGCYSADLTRERNIMNKDKINRVPRIKENIIEEHKDSLYVYLDDKSDYFIIDKKNIDLLHGRYFKKDTNGYWIAWRRESDDNSLPKSIKIHQEVAKEKYGKYSKELIPDHLNRNKNDNRESNIILKTIADNTHNRSLSKNNKSGKTGVYFKNDIHKWIACIMVNYKNIYLGSFKTYEDAVKVRKEAEKKYGFTCDDVFPEQDYETL